MILSANWRSPWLTITPSGMIKVDRKVKASGFENLRPYHRMESMRKSNILSWLLLLLVSLLYFYCYCTFINLYVGFQFVYVCSFICATSGSFVPHMDCQKLFLKLYYLIRHC
jgi:hypothetical protein